MPLALTAHTATSCLGAGLAAQRDALRAGRSGLVPCDFDGAALDTWIGRVAGLDAVPLPAALARYDCRNHRLAWLALNQDGFLDQVRATAARVGPARVGVLLGTSTSGILETERAYRRRPEFNGALPPDFDYFGTHSLDALAEFTRQACGLGGPAWVVSTACSSSAKVFADAARLIACGLIDAAVVGGVDSLCLTTLYGFNSLELTAAEPCRPFDAERRGLSIGEAAAFVLLARPEPGQAGLWLSGYGESSDAHHMSAPHPEGLGARMAMASALAMAGLTPAQIDYINLHGTATPSNDAAEGRAVADLFGATVPASSTKGATGHTLGAAGALEAVFCAEALLHGFIPASPGTRHADPALALDYRLASTPAPLRRVLSNSFGFGGTNCSLVFERHDGSPA